MCAVAVVLLGTKTKGLTTDSKANDVLNSELEREYNPAGVYERGSTKQQLHSLIFLTIRFLASYHPPSNISQANNLIHSTRYAPVIRVSTSHSGPSHFSLAHGHIIGWSWFRNIISSFWTTGLRRVALRALGFLIGLATISHFASVAWNSIRAPPFSTLFDRGTELRKNLEVISSNAFPATAVRHSLRPVSDSGTWF